MKLPYMPFYIGDWRKDPGVQSLDFHHRGLWFEILCLMYESGQRGKLLLNGKPMPEEALARLLGLDKQNLTKALTLLLDNGVAQRCETSGAIMSRRMVRDEEIRRKRAEVGKLGGNPRLSKKPDLVNQKSNQNPESENEDEDETAAFCSREGIAKGMRMDGFPAAWRDWRNYRSESNEPLTSYTAKQQLAKCERMGAKKAVEAIHLAMEKSWKNLFAEGEIQHGNNRSKSSRSSSQPDPKSGVPGDENIRPRLLN